MNSKKYHYIYKITRFDGAYYIGLHSTNDLNDGYFGSGTRIRRSVKCHGRDAHTLLILEFYPTRESLVLREGEIVNQALLDDPLCMNILPGGTDNLNRSAIVNAQRGRFVSEETRLKMSESAKRRTDRTPHSEEAKAKMSAATKGKQKTAEHRAKISEIAKQRDEVWSEKMSESRGSACTVDGITIYPSKRALAKALGYGKTGMRHPNFRFV